MDNTYLDFMLGKRNNDVPPTTPKTPKDRTNVKKKSVYRLILKAMQGRLEEWKEIDKKMEDVLRSITNLRDRIYWESDHQRKQPNISDERSTPVHHQKKAAEKRPSWKDYGFRKRFSNYICTKEDIRLALHHDLLKHEQMLISLRRLLASLAQIVDEIGRRLDEWMVQNLMDQNNGVSEETEFDTLVKEQRTIELAQEVYAQLALDLYAKQKIATQVFDSCRDGLLGGEEHISKLDDSRNVMKTISNGLKKATDRRELTRDLVRKMLLL